jgi:uncharacterized protein DUF6894
MPRFYFHLHTGTAVQMDQEGVEFPSLEATLADAYQAWREDLRDEGIDDSRQCHFEITDEQGRVLAVVPRGDL